MELDTYPFGSHTTGSDMLWAGVPLVAQMGETFASRVSGSLLTVVGLQELVTYTDDDYLTLADALAKDRPHAVVLTANILPVRDSQLRYSTRSVLHGIWDACFVPCGKTIVAVSNSRFGFPMDALKEFVRV